MMTSRAGTLFTLLLIASAPALAKDLTTDPIKWFDADNKNIPEPAEIEENQIWDIIDHTLFHQVGKVLDLGWTSRRVGSLIGVVEPRQADNVNAIDEVANSSWYTNRHFLHPMTLDELGQGPGFARPDDSGPWEIVRGKFEGGTAGFIIKDAAGQGYLLKFDSEGNNEMGSAAGGYRHQGAARRRLPRAAQLGRLFRPQAAGDRAESQGADRGWPEATDEPGRSAGHPQQHHPAARRHTALRRQQVSQRPAGGDLQL